MSDVRQSDDQDDAIRTMLHDAMLRRAIAQQWGLLTSDIMVVAGRILLRSNAAIGLMRRYGMHTEAKLLEQSPSSLVDMVALEQKIFIRQMGLDAIVPCRPVRPRMSKLARIGRAIGTFVGTLHRP